MEQGTRGYSWTLEGKSLLSTLSDLDPMFDSQIFPASHLSVKSYTVFTENSKFHRTASFTDALEMAEEEPIRIIAHYGRIDGSTHNSAVNSVDVIYHSQFGPGKVVVKIEVNGKIGAETNSYFQSLRDWFDRTALDLASQTPSASGTENSESISRSGGSIEAVQRSSTSIFDDADKLLTIQGIRAPRVFISYSHDDDKHKNWVLTLANRLNSLRVWVIFDQFDVTLGSNLAAFMESGLSEADRVIAVCTPKYVAKTNNFQGGAGYERTILTQDLMTSQLGNRIIPLIRDQKSPAKLPLFLSTRNYIDFSDDTQFDEKITELGIELLNAKSKRPPFGAANP
ncbi:toll/interleukin-1 receptor domain-containing protein [Rhodococcus sp. NPDC003322]